MQSKTCLALQNPLSSPLPTSLSPYSPFISLLPPPSSSRPLKLSLPGSLNQKYFKLGFINQQEIQSSIIKQWLSKIWPSFTSPEAGYDWESEEYGRPSGHFFAVEILGFFKPNHVDDQVVWLTNWEKPSDGHWTDLITWGVVTMMRLI